MVQVETNCFGEYFFITSPVSNSNVLSVNANMNTNFNRFLVNYIAGYGAAAVSSYPLPYDLKQVIIEMAVQSFKEGIITSASLDSKCRRRPL